MTDEEAPADEPVVRVCGDLDRETAPAFMRHIAGLIYHPTIAPGDALLVDLSAVTFLDSAGLRALIEAKSRVEAARLRFRLVGVTRPVRSVIEVTALATFFGLVPFHESQ